MASASTTWTPPAVPGVAFDQRLGEQLPLDGSYRDDTGAQLRLSDLFGHEPVILLFGYSRCPQLCSVVANGAVETLRRMTATAGRDFQVIFVSIDPTDTTRELAALKRRDVKRYGREAAWPGWHYLAGDAATVRHLADAAGFRFTFDSRQKLYAHPSGFIVATADGRVARYFLGVDFDGREIASAIDRARRGEIGDPVFNLLLACARQLGPAGKYGAVIWSALSIAVVATVAALSGGIAWMLRQERRAARERAG